MKDASDKKRILLEVGTNEVEFLEFGIAGQKFGVNVAKVLQVLVLKNLKLTKMPGSDEYFMGTLSVREKEIPTYNLPKILGIESKPEGPQGSLVLLMEYNRRVNAFVVDSVNDIERVSWEEFNPIEEVDKLSTGEPSVIGTVTIKDNIVLILDMEAVLERFDTSVSIKNYEQFVSREEKTDRSAVRLLYCEDSPVIRKMTLSILNNAGFTNIEVFPTGAKGLDYLLSEKGKDVDVILTDIEMPELDGLSFCKSVKSNPNFSKIPVVFFSSLVNDSLKAKCLAVQGDACFSKPEIHLVSDAIEELYISSKEK